jgi:tetratricopeptide (TPR) repeat protein
MRRAGHPSARSIAIQAVAAGLIAPTSAARRGGVIRRNLSRTLCTLAVVSALAGVCSPAVGQWSPNGPANHGAAPGKTIPNQPLPGAARRPGNVPPPVSPAVNNATTAVGRQLGNALMAGTSTAILNGMTPAQIDAALGYRPDPQISAQVRANAIAATSANNPALRPTLEQAFANDAALKAFDVVVSSHGYSSRNIADAMAALLWTSYQIVNGVTLTDGQIRGIHQQVRAIFMSTAELRDTAPVRQQFTETIAYVIVALMAATQTTDQAMLAQARRSTAETVRTMIAVDLANLEVTPDSGFRQKRAAPSLANGPAASAGTTTAAVQKPPLDNSDLAVCGNNDNKDFNHRIDACSRVIASNGGNIAVLLPAYAGRGNAFGELKQLDRMTADFDELVRIAPQNPIAYVVRADGLIKRHDYDRAVADLDKALASQPNPVVAETYATRAHAYLRMPRYDRAIADINKAISIKPDLSTAYAIRSLYNLEQDNNNAALADASEAIRLESGNDVFYLLRAEAYLRLNQITEAQAEADRALGLNPRSASAHDSRGRIALAQGRIEVALGEFTQAVELDDQLPDAFASRGVAYERSGKADLALADYRRAAQATPSDKMDRDAQATARQRIAALTAMAAAGPASVAAAPPGRRIALVIGMSAYVNVAPLRNPVSDARAVAEAFRRLGFAEVIEREDLTRAKLEETLKEFGDKAGESDWAVIYYAGHGVEMNGVNYLVPVDAKLARAEHVEDEAVTLTRALSKAEAARRLRMVILDACRNNPFRMASAEGRTRSIGRGLSAVEPARGVLVAYAARDGTTADDGDSGHSPFTQALLTHLETPGVDIRIMFSKVRDSVLARTNNAQEPFTYGSLPGQEFYFREATR